MPKIADKEERRNSIIDATFSVIVREGLSGTSMRTVASEAGCTIGMINHWFASRDDLIEATFDRVISLEMERAAEVVSDPASYIKAASKFLPIDEQRKNEAKVWISFYAMVLSSSGKDELRSARCKAVRNSLLEGLKHYFDRKTCHNIADHILVMVDGIAINALLDPKHWTPARQLRVIREGLESTLARHSGHAGESIA